MKYGNLVGMCGEWGGRTLVILILIVSNYSNGDQYEGDWVSGMRHGHGMIHCADGTLYDVS